MKKLWNSLIFCALLVINFAQTNQKDMLSKADLKVILEDHTKKRCEDIENLLELDPDLEIYNLDSGKYLVYVKSDNLGILYDSLDELKEVATPPDQIPDYEQWLRDIDLKVGDIEETQKNYPELKTYLNLGSIDIKNLQSKLNQGKFMQYNPKAYKEFLLFTVEYLKQNHEEFDLLLESEDEYYELFIEYNNKKINLTTFVWNNFFEPDSGFFNSLKSIFKY